MNYSDFDFIEETEVCKCYIGLAGDYYTPPRFLITEGQKIESYENVIVSFNFCPLCGRKLEERISKVLCGKKKVSLEELRKKDFEHLIFY